jgi:hypothetical protein
MLKANEILSLYALIKKADCEELKQISRCLEDEFTLKYNIESIDKLKCSNIRLHNFTKKGFLLFNEDTLCLWCNKSLKQIREEEYTK